MRHFFRIFILAGLLCTFSVHHAFAQTAELTPDTITIVKARVTKVEQKPHTTLASFDTPTPSQKLTAEILEGRDKGTLVTFDNDFTQLNVGDVFYMDHTANTLDGTNYHSVRDPYRVPLLLSLTILLIGLVVAIGGKQGVRGLIALAGSFVLILFVLIPGILKGYSPLSVSLGVAALIVILGSYITHGFNKTTTTAVFGMILTVLCTGALAYATIHFGKFTGYGTEEAVYLNMNFNGNIDIRGLLLAGIIIGLLGVLYDTAISQSIAVEELHKIAPHVPRKDIWKRAMRIGREHIGALVDTLALAYVGTSLPLILLFSTPPIQPLMTINTEVFAAEIIRILIGSIGLVLAVPITTAISVWMLVKPISADIETISQEKKHIESHSHSH